MSRHQMFPTHFVVGSEYPWVALCVARHLTELLAQQGRSQVQVSTFDQLGLAEMKQDTTGDTSADRARNTAWLYFNRYGPILARQEYTGTDKWCIVVVDHTLVVPSLAGLEGHRELPGVARSHEFFHSVVHDARSRFMRLMGGRRDREATSSCAAAFLSSLFNFVQNGMFNGTIARSYDHSVKGHAWEPLLMFQTAPHVRVNTDQQRWHQQCPARSAISQGLSSMRNRPDRLLHTQGDDRVPQGMHLYIWDGLEGAVPLVRTSDEPTLAAS